MTTEWWNYQRSHSLSVYHTGIFRENQCWLVIQSGWQPATISSRFNVHSTLNNIVLCVIMFVRLLSVSTLNKPQVKIILYWNSRCFAAPCYCLAVHSSLICWNKIIFTIKWGKCQWIRGFDGGKHSKAVTPLNFHYTDLSQRADEIVTLLRASPPLQSTSRQSWCVTWIGWAALTVWQGSTFWPFL